MIYDNAHLLRHKTSSITSGSCFVCLIAILSNFTWDLLHQTQGWSETRHFMNNKIKVKSIEWIVKSDHERLSLFDLIQDATCSLN